MLPETEQEWLDRMKENAAKYGTVDADDLERLIEIAENTFGQWKNKE